MRPLHRRHDARNFDAEAIAQGVPGLVLMENAGRRATDLLCERFASHLRNVLVVTGPGQNGGDGWVVARHLRSRGFNAKVFPLCPSVELTGDARVNALAFEALFGTEAIAAELGEAVTESTLLIDALFGTGLTRPVTGAFAEAVAALNASPAPTVALDLPSGVDGDSGAVLGCAINAEQTITFGAEKPGLCQHPGRGLSGEVLVADLGVPPSGPAKNGAPDWAIYEDADLAALPRRPANAHKGHGGHIAILGGVRGKTGAALLAATGALRAGSGRVTIVAPNDAQDAYDAKVVEIMTAGAAGLDQLTEHFAGKQCLVLGPGYGTDEAHLERLRHLAIHQPEPAVLDADALTAFAGRLGELKNAPTRILTPHPAEAARLLGTSTPTVQGHRTAAALRLAEESGQVAVLKGAGTIVACPQGRLRISLAGCPAMGVAGTGDVLAGAIAAFAATLDDAFAAAIAGVHLHALAGERAALGRDRGMRARELADALSWVLPELR